MVVAELEGAEEDVHCRICGCRLGVEEDDDYSAELCGSCGRRPEASRLGVVGKPALHKQSAEKPRWGSAREFTPAEKSLIGKVHGFMPPEQLLRLVNERLSCDLGPDASPYTMEQLYAEIGDVSESSRGGEHDWPTLRKLIAQARRVGTLELIDQQVIEDFAVVYSLNERQVMVVKDVLLQEKED